MDEHTQSQGKEIALPAHITTQEGEVLTGTVVGAEGDVLDDLDSYWRRQAEKRELRREEIRPLIDLIYKASEVREEGDEVPDFSAEELRALYEAATLSERQLPLTDDEHDFLLGVLMERSVPDDFARIYNAKPETKAPLTPAQAFTVGLKDKLLTPQLVPRVFEEMETLSKDDVLYALDLDLYDVESVLQEGWLEKIQHPDAQFILNLLDRLKDGEYDAELPEDWAEKLPADQLTKDFATALLERGRFDLLLPYIMQFTDFSVSDALAFIESHSPHDLFNAITWIPAEVTIDSKYAAEAILDDAMGVDYLEHDDHTYTTFTTDEIDQLAQAGKMNVLTILGEMGVLGMNETELAQLMQKYQSV